MFNTLAFVSFGLDKWRSTQTGRRVPESFLILPAALGGWPGGLIGMKVFRHKTAKWSFRLKYMLALVPFALEVYAFICWR
ncbi:MAG TPA: DUF1294 domain-containing protein [Verrucomicrobiae bacterium]|nr:DUF1294 domain-containing protein [Verrucomicrobiae bacterium]